MAYRTDVIKALINLYNKDLRVSPKPKSTGNRINDEGTQLEKFIEELFYDPNAKNTNEKKKCFSYPGQKNYPPDLILKQGDAIEIKKIQTSRAGEIALNSSWPRDKLRRNDEKLSNQCLKCEDEYGGWQEKDIFYVIGVITKKIETIFFVQGVCIAASHYSDFYKRVRNAIHETVRTFETTVKVVENTTELGKLKEIDELGHTTMRIRGMFRIQNPLITFKDHCNPDEKKDLNVFCLMTETKYKSFDSEDTNALEKLADSNVKRNVPIQDPQDGISELKCVFVSFGINI